MEKQTKFDWMVHSPKAGTTVRLYTIPELDKLNSSYNLVEI